MRRKVLMMGLGVMCIAQLARAAAPAPAPAPAPTSAKTPTTRVATAPTSVPVDQTTPKGALKFLARALEAGDRKMLLDVLDAASPNERKIAEATAELAEATAEL